MCPIPLRYMRQAQKCYPWKHNSTQPNLIMPFNNNINNQYISNALNPSMLRAFTLLWSPEFVLVNTVWPH